MVKIAVLLVIVLVSTGLVADPVTAASDPLARLAASDAGASGDFADPIGPLAFMILYNNLYTCYEMFARQSGQDTFSLRGQTKFFNDLAFVQAVIGLALISGSEVFWGLEAFPNPLLPVAAKIGGSFALATLLGAGTGFHLTPQGIFLLSSFAFQLLAGPCPPQFLADIP
jgi:hypothetical protein